jgi:hypothetical protein
MPAPPEPSTEEVLAGLVERVTYHYAENGNFARCAPAHLGIERLAQRIQGRVQHVKVTPGTRTVLCFPVPP